MLFNETACASIAHQRFLARPRYNRAELRGADSPHDREARPMSNLKGADRRFLRSKAHHLKPVVQIGQQGLTEAVLSIIDQNLTAHELIKIHFGDFKDQKKALAVEIAEAMEAEVAGIVGHIAILYRQHPESDKRHIKLPRRAAQD